MSDEQRADYAAVFRDSWRERQSTGKRLGGLIRQPRWIDAGLVMLAALLIAGAVAGATVTVARTTSFPAVTDGVTVSAILGSAPAPVVGSPARFRSTTGTTDAVVVEVIPTEVIARLSTPVAPAGGQLLMPAGKEPLFAMLIPRLG